MEALSRPVSGNALLTNGKAPACLLRDWAGSAEPSAGQDLVPVDLVIQNGRILSIDPAGTQGAEQAIDLDGGLILPCLVDVHTHLDKGHIWDRKPNPDGTFLKALEAVETDRAANWSAGDLKARMTFALRCAYAHGTSAIRTHIDSIPPQDGISWPVFEEVRDTWAGRIDLQAACLFGIERVADDPGFLPGIADRMVASKGILGAVTYMMPDLETHIEAVFRAAADRGLDLDFHVDETLDADADSLRLIAEVALRTRFPGRILVGHCCSLSTQPDSKAFHTLDRVAEAGIAVVSLPLCNLYLQARVSERTPRYRGVTLLHEMRARGIPVSVASDNTRDPFYAYGDLDLIEVFAQSTRIAHLDHPVGDWITAVSSVPAAAMGIEAGRLGAGQPADLIIFRARTWNELLARPHGPRTVLRAGTTIDRALPDYRELDHLMKTGEELT